MNKIVVKNSPKKGKGVFAKEEIQKDEVVEVSPIIILEFSELVGTKWNTLFNYYFWLDDFVVLALGYGSIYNYSDNPNSVYKINKNKKTITFTAIKNINKGAEIFINYKGHSSSKTPLWFEVR